jgi:hypothetical protein
MNIILIDPELKTIIIDKHEDINFQNLPRIFKKRRQRNQWGKRRIRKRTS